MRNIATPTRAVSFEDALRNLAAKLTGTSAASLPRTQEGVVQYMAERIPSVDELAEAITKEVVARLTPAEPPAAEEPGTDQPQEAAKNSTGRKRKTTKD